MDCWEFHHIAGADGQSWFWRRVERDGRVVAESTGHFSTFMRAFADAIEHGFDETIHEWYLANATLHPCAKVVEEGRGKETTKPAPGADPLPSRRAAGTR